MATEDQVLTVGEAAERLGVSHDKMSRLLREGAVRSYRNPLDRREKLVLVDDLEALRALPRRGEEGMPRFLSDGAASNPDAPNSDELKEWLRANWRPLE